jgi:hypothetical protein
MTRRWTSEFGGFLGMRPSDFVGQEGITARDMAPYEGPTDEALDEAGVEAYFLGQFVQWDSRRNLTVSIDHGFESALPCNANWWRGENLDNAQTGLHDYMMWRKYGYGRACAQLSVDVRNGVLDREKALEHLESREGRFPEVYAGVYSGTMLDQIGIDRARLEVIMADFGGPS